MPDFDNNINVTHNGERIIQLRAERGDISIGRAGIPGTLRVADGENAGVIFMAASSGTIHVGKQGTPGVITVADANNNATITLDGQAGDLILANADCAEEFDVSDDVAVEPGSVMVVDSELMLRPCNSAYDKRVAGVASGAGNYRPGIIFDRQSSARQRVPIAVLGKVYCKVDAQYGAIEVGDLLTTSPNSGYAMRVDNPMRAFGAVIGKALQCFKSGKGLIRVLVALQ